MSNNLYINIYKEGSTQGVYDSCVSSDGSGSNPILIGPLNIAESESRQKKLLLKTEPGYKTIVGRNTIVKPVGPSASKWELALDNNGVSGAFSSSLSIVTQILPSGIYIWVKALSVEGELVKNDASVDIEITYSIYAV
ncbi:MAG: hypothetical protein K0R18_2611 [Bacillales bacterium]|jgi:hypothetical protein|nr:hypothetical protein [Bacillales bacterium]